MTHLPAACMRYPGHCFTAAGGVWVGNKAVIARLPTEPYLPLSVPFEEQVEFYRQAKGWP